MLIWESLPVLIAGKSSERTVRGDWSISIFDDIEWRSDCNEKRAMNECSRHMNDAHEWFNRLQGAVSYPPAKKIEYWNEEVIDRWIDGHKWEKYQIDWKWWREWRWWSGGEKVDDRLSQSTLILTPCHRSGGWKPFWLMKSSVALIGPSSGCERISLSKTPFAFAQFPWRYSSNPSVYSARNSASKPAKINRRSLSFWMKVSASKEFVSINAAVISFLCFSISTLSSTESS